jgi:hypothetical protein
MDHCAIDLDPGEGAGLDKVLDVARWVKEEMDRLGVPGFPKTSGSRGLHIYIPLPPKTTYESGQLLCHLIATLVCDKHPESGHDRAHGEEASARHGVRGLSAEHPWKDPRDRVFGARQRLCGGLDTPEVDRSRPWS